MTRQNALPCENARDRLGASRCSQLERTRRTRHPPRAGHQRPDQYSRHDDSRLELPRPRRPPRRRWRGVYGGCHRGRGRRAALLALASTRGRHHRRPRHPRPAARWPRDPARSRAGRCLVADAIPDRHHGLPHSRPPRRICLERPAHRRQRPRPLGHLAGQLRCERFVAQHRNAGLDGPVVDLGRRPSHRRIPGARRGPRCRLGDPMAHHGPRRE